MERVASRCGHRGRYNTDDRPIRFIANKPRRLGRRLRLLLFFGLLVDDQSKRQERYRFDLLLTMAMMMIMMVMVIVVIMVNMAKGYNDNPSRRRVFSSTCVSQSHLVEIFRQRFPIFFSLLVELYSTTRCRRHGEVK